MESAITSKGRVTIPKAVRNHLGLKPGNRIKFFIHPDGSVSLMPKLAISGLRGVLKTQRRVTLEEMDKAIAAGAADRVARRPPNDRAGC